MLLIISIVVLLGSLLYYVLNLDFEIGSGISELKDKAKEVPYRRSAGKGIEEQSSGNQDKE